jgi:tyrosyl-tRNA synthetase
LQGYDSVHLKCGIEIGGMDQKFNLLVGRELQKSFGQNPQSIIMLPLLEGLDGKMKMSKSLGNAICLNHSPQEMFGKIMSISDTLLEKYITLLSVGSKDSKKAFIEYLHMDTNPRDVKMLLAEELTALYHGPDAAISTKAEFIDRFQKKALPKNSEIVTLQVTENGLNIVHLLKYSCLTKTNMEARRHIKSGAVRINGEKIDNESYMIYANSENLFQVGKTKARVVRLRQWIASADQLTNSHTQDRSE